MLALSSPRVVTAERQPAAPAGLRDYMRPFTSQVRCIKFSLPLCGACPIVGYCGFLNKLLTQKSRESLLLLSAQENS